MPIGAAIGTAAITAGGAALSASSQKKAAGKAADTAAANSAANNALAREIYGKNSANLLPYSESGMRAGNALNEMLLGPKTGAAGTDWAGYVNANPDAMVDYRLHHNDMSISDYGQYHYNADGARRDLSAFQPQAQGAPANGTAQPSAWDQFRNSTNYQFRLNEGMKAGNQGYAANGMLESGAAMKGLNDYAQNFASNELGNYQNLLAQQQGIGVGAVSALAGVGNTMVNNVTANNNSAAQVAAQAALQRGAANGQMWGTIAGAAGNALGGFGGSSYGR